MEVKLLRCRHTDIIDRLVLNFKIGKPVFNEYGERVGTVLKVWRDGHFLIGDIECVPEDINKGKWCHFDAY